MSKMKRQHSFRISLYVELVLAILLSTIISIVALILFSVLLEFFFNSSCFANHFVAPYTNKYAEELQDYIDKNQLQITDNKSLDRFMDKRSDMGLMILCQGDVTASIKADINANVDSVYDVLNDYWVSYKNHSSDLIYAYRYSYILNYIDGYYANALKDKSYQPLLLTFDGKEYTAIVIQCAYLKFIYLFNYSTIFLAFACFIFVLLLFIHRKIRYLKWLAEDITILSSGDLDHQVAAYGYDEIGTVGRDLEQMRIALKKQMESEREAISANNSLVTALSHDLRTPLTTQLGYLEILQEKRYNSEEEYEDYLARAINNLGHIKELSDRLFEYFLAFDRSTTTLHKLENVDALQLLLQLITEHTILLEEQGYSFTLKEPEKEILIRVNPDDVARIFNNIFSNIEKYASKEDTINISIFENKEHLVVSVTNEIAIRPRKNESSKVGIECMKALMRRQNGSLQIQMDQKTFTVHLFFTIQDS